MNRVQILKTFAHQIRAALSNVLIFCIKIYQYILSPILGPRCRFYPSCSNYGVLALQKYGAFRGSKKLITRLCKCHPFHKGGVDLP